MRLRAWSSLTAIIVFQLSCDTAVHETVVDDVSRACAALDPLVISVGPGRYAINTMQLDSARLLAAIPMLLGPRPSNAILLRVDSAQASQVDWIVHAVRRSGGEAYRFATCDNSTARLVRQLLRVN